MGGAAAHARADDGRNAVPYVNALFAHVWYTGGIKLANVGPHLCPSSISSLDVIFERKLVDEDGSASDQYFINEELIAKIFYLIACSPSATAALMEENL